MRDPPSFPVHRRGAQHRLAGGVGHRRWTTRVSCARSASVAWPLQTSLPGIFAIGDVRSGSVKRVAAAVGEGAHVVAAIHAYLAAAGDKATHAAQFGGD